jgi:hypothetical protein
MSDLGGAILLSQQLSLYRMLDSFDQARDNSRAAANDAAWRNQYNDLVNRYNQLLQDANRLADVQDRALAGKDGQIAELKATNAALVAQTEKLTVELADSKATVKFLRGLDRELHPEVYRSAYEEE